jgi:flagellar hook-associated protein 3 FlgL
MTSFRIGYERSLYQSFSGTSAIHAQQRDLAKVREEMVTGLKVNRPSDNPVAFEQARNAATLTDRYTNYLSSVENARMWVDRTEQSLDHLNELLAQAKEEGLRAANSFRSNTDLDAIAARLEGLLAEMVDTMNTKSGNEHLFAGARTGLPPFDANGQPTADVQDLGGARVRQIGPGSPMQINVSGEQLFNVNADLTLTAGIQGLIDAIRDRDMDAMSSSIGDVETSREHVALLGTETGSRARRLSLAETNLREATLISEADRSRHEDADMIDTAMRLQKSQAGLQAAMQVTAMSLQTSILDFLR